MTITARWPRAIALAAVLVLVGCGSAGQPSGSGGDMHATPGMRLSALKVAPAATAGTESVQVEVRVTNPRPRPIQVQAQDFSLLAADGDIFAQAGAPTPAGALDGEIAPGASRAGELTFQVPAVAVPQACVLFRLADEGLMTCAQLAGVTSTTASAAGSEPDVMTTIHEYPLDDNDGGPWGMAVNAEGDVWFAEPGCNFPFSCSASSPAGAIGVRLANSGEVQDYPLPELPGNQPLFVALDTAGKVWFTTPNNSMIGEFDPASQHFVGQWPVVSESGPWSLTFSHGLIWYTENYISAIGEFNPVTHAYRDFATPTPNSSPYGIVANDPINDNLIWFTENNASAAQIGVLDMANGDHISEYAIRGGTPTGLTPHELALDSRGDPWWTEGTYRAIGTLDPKVAKPGACSASAGECPGVAEYPLPPAPSDCPNSHASGIAIGTDHIIWVTDSLAAQIGRFDPTTHQFTLFSLSDCNAHPHDGLAVDASLHVWWGETFANTLGELTDR